MAGVEGDAQTGESIWRTVGGWFKLSLVPEVGQSLTDSVVVGET